MFEKEFDVIASQKFFLIEKDAEIKKIDREIKRLEKALELLRVH